MELNTGEFIADLAIVINKHIKPSTTKEVLEILDRIEKAIFYSGSNS